jgi:hypothetical protein
MENTGARIPSWPIRWDPRDWPRRDGVHQRHRVDIEGLRRGECAQQNEVRDHEVGWPRA